MKKIFILIATFLCIYSNTISQEQSNVANKSNWKMIANIQYVTQHYWRGLGKGPIFANSPAFEPSLTFTDGSWNMGVMTGTSFDNIYAAVVPWISYSPIKNLSIGIWDMYSPGSKFWETDPLDFKLASSKHCVDAMITYKFDFNLGLKAATLFLGGDDPDKDGKANYTSYLEANYSYAWGQFSTYAAVGATPWKGLYSRNKAGIVNVEAKFQYNFVAYEKVSIPIYVRTCYNPIADYFQFVAGASVILPFDL